MEGLASSWPLTRGVTTTSTSLNKTVNGLHQFKISGYSLMNGIGIGTVIASDVFKVGGYDWTMYFYPHGRHVEDRGAYVSLFLGLASDAKDVRALHSVTLKDQSGEERHRMSSYFERVPDNGPFIYKCRGTMWGYRRFLRRTVLERSGFLKDDCLLIECCVGVVKSRTELPRIYSIPVPPSNMGKQFRMLLESGKDTDVNLEVDGEIFVAHKLVLTARSPVFRAQLLGPMKNKNTRCIKVEDIMPPIFKALLHFIYCDTLPDMHEIMGSNSKRVSILVAQHLLVAADLYALERLKLLCEAKLCEGLTIDTAATTLALAEQHYCFQLKAVCLKFIASHENLKAVMQTNEFEHLKESCPTVIEELFQNVATVGEHFAEVSADANPPCLDGNENDRNGRRVKPRLS